MHHRCILQHALRAEDVPDLDLLLKKNLSGCTPLVVLGLLRLVCVTCLGYHENVTEYGSHWNFFFTLASVRLLSSLVQVLVTSTKAVWVTSVAVAVMYEGLLTFYLADWILATDTPRDNIVNSNREGLFSSLGYLSIYLAGERMLHLFTIIYTLSFRYQEYRGDETCLSLIKLCPSSW